MRIQNGVLAFLLLVPTIASADALRVSGCGASVPARIAEFRALLGGPVNGATPGQAPSGRREINWDGVPAGVTNNDSFPGGFFSTTSTRGLVMTSLGSGLRVSDNNFVDVNPSYAAQFATFSPVKSFAVIGGNAVDVTFQVPGSTTAASVKGFGVVFSDVDVEGSSSIELFSGADGYGRYSAPARCDGTGLSFIGVIYDGNERITRVRVVSGAAAIGGSVSDVTSGGANDLVVMDDFVYSEPSPLGQILTAALSGTEEVPNPGDPDGTGFASVTFDMVNNIVRYTISVQNIDAPTAGHIHTGGAGVAGPVLVSFSPTFVNGAASGSVNVSASTMQNILNNAGGFYVNIHNPAFPGGAVRGQLSYRQINPTRLVFPVVGRVAGAGGTEYRADIRLVNLSGLQNDVLLEYYAAGTAANAAPTATVSVSIAPGEQKVLDNVAKTLFNVDAGTGALRVISSRPLYGTGRIYNDQRASGAGTFGQFILAADDNQAFNRGILPQLSNQPAGSRIGSRTNIGWFNPRTTLANVTFRAYDNNGKLLSTSQAQAIQPSTHLQVPLVALFPGLEAMDNLYVTFDSDNDSLFVYASVADNVNGDAIYVPAQRR